MTRDHFGLTPRQREVLQLIADGGTHHTVAENLGLSFRTVESHMHSVLAAMRAKTAAHAVAEAIRKEVID